MITGLVYEQGRIKLSRMHEAWLVNLRGVFSAGLF
jgi:hypothetical protein